MSRNGSLSACAKTAYGQQEHAVNAAVKRAFRFPGLHLGVYRCPKCKSWHLTKRRQ